MRPYEWMPNNDLMPDKNHNPLDISLNQALPDDGNSKSKWILLSDEFVAEYISDRKIAKMVGMVKGWIYVLTSAILTFSLVYSAIRKVKILEEKT